MCDTVCVLTELRSLRRVVTAPQDKPYGLAAWAMLILLVVAGGCNPVKTGVKLGVHLAGDVVEDADVKERARALVGRPVSDADQMFGKTIDVFKDTRSDRRWRTYAVKLDALNRQRYVVEVVADRVVSVSKAEKSSRKVDIPRAIILKETLKGKTPQECEARLELGRPLLAARSDNTRRLVQIYDAGMLTDLGTPHYCIVRFDANDRCDDIEFVAVGASTKKAPLAR